MQDQPMPCPTCGHAQEEPFASVVYWPQRFAAALHWASVIIALSILAVLAVAR